MSPETLCADGSSLNVSEWLARQLLDFDPAAAIEAAWLPPSSWYIAPEIFQAEKETIFKNNWLIAARAEQVSQPGQYVAGVLAGEPYIIVRDQSGSLNAFYNVCRHHAAEVALGEGCLQKLQCPYHGWTYGLDGKLESAPGLGLVKDFDREHFGLPPMHCAEWCGLVFVSRKDKPQPIAEDLLGLKVALAETRLGDLTFVERRKYMVDCNWKVFVDNYLDGGYHVPHMHKGLAGQLDLSTYVTEVFGRYSVQSTAGVCKKMEHDGSPDSKKVPPSTSPAQDFAERLGDKAFYAWIYPNLMINRYGSIMDTNWVLPVSHDRTLVIMDFYFEKIEGQSAASFIKKSLSASEVVQQEDMKICESVQRGLLSSSYNKGRYSSKYEIGEHHFHKLLAEDFRTLLR